MKKKYLVSIVLSAVVLLGGCAHSHEYGEWKVVKEPSCTTAGLREHTCTKKDCDEKESEDIPAVGHNYVNGVCTLCNEKE